MSKISYYLKKNGIKDNKVIAKAEYGLAALKSEIVKLILFSLFFFMYGRLIYFIFSLAVILPIRIYSGGLHMNTQFKCILFSFITFYSAICLLPLIKLHPTCFIILQTLCLIITIYISPVSNRSKPIKTQSRYNSLKKKVAIFSISNYFVLVIIMKISMQFYEIGFWITIINTMQLLLAWEFYKEKEKEYSNEYHRKNIS